jgi:hypothetical protein
MLWIMYVLIGGMRMFFMWIRRIASLPHIYWWVGCYLLYKFNKRRHERFVSKVGNWRLYVMRWIEWRLNATLVLWGEAREAGKQGLMLIDTYWDCIYCLLKSDRLCIWRSEKELEVEMSNLDSTLAKTLSAEQGQEVWRRWRFVDKQFIWWSQGFKRI